MGVEEYEGGGLYEGDDTPEGVPEAGDMSDAPQLSQNASPGMADAPHTGHEVEPSPLPPGRGVPAPTPTVPPTGAGAPWARTGVPQASQKDTPSGNSTPQFAQ
jgi:hypothetical protein